MPLKYATNYCRYTQTRSNADSLGRENFCFDFHSELLPELEKWVLIRKELCEVYFHFELKRSFPRPKRGLTPPVSPLFLKKSGINMASLTSPSWYCFSLEKQKPQPAFCSLFPPSNYPTLTSTPLAPAPPVGRLLVLLASFHFPAGCILPVENPTSCMERALGVPRSTPVVAFIS